MFTNIYPYYTQTLKLNTRQTTTTLSHRLTCSIGDQSAVLTLKKKKKIESKIFIYSIYKFYTKNILNPLQ